jgi:hypothetical protein
MSRRQRQDGETSQWGFLLYQGRDQDRIPSNQTRGATQRRIIVEKHSRTVAVRETKIECLERLQEMTIS